MDKLIPISSGITFVNSDVKIMFLICMRCDKVLQFATCKIKCISAPLPAQPPFSMCRSCELKLVICQLEFHFGKEDIVTRRRIFREAGSHTLGCLHWKFSLRCVMMLQERRVLTVSPWGMKPRCAAPSVFNKTEKTKKLPGNIADLLHCVWTLSQNRTVTFCSYLLCALL